MVENKKICGGFCEKLGMGLGVGFRYYVNTSVVVCCYNNESEYRRKNYFGFGRDIFSTQRCWWGSSINRRQILRRRCYSPNPCLLIWQNQKHDGRSYTKTSDDISTNRRNESLTSIVHAPLRSGKRTERRYVYKWYGVFGFDIIYTQRCWWGCILYSRDIWREDSQNRRATDAFADGYNRRIYRCEKYLCLIFWDIFYAYSVVVCCYNNES